MMKTEDCTINFFFFFSCRKNNVVIFRRVEKIYIKKQKAYAFKSYLRYKTITSQNVSSEAQIKNFFTS